MLDQHEKNRLPSQSHNRFEAIAEEDFEEEDEDDVSSSASSAVPIVVEKKMKVRPLDLSSMETGGKGAGRQWGSRFVQ